MVKPVFLMSHVCMMMFQPFQSITLRFELLLEAQIMSWSTIKLPSTVNEKSHALFGVLIWFHSNSRNLNPRNSQFLASFSFVSFTHCAPLSWDLNQKMQNFYSHLLIQVKSLPEDVHLLKHPRKCFQVDFWGPVPRKLVRVRYHCKWFLMLYNLSYSDKGFIS